MEFPARVGSLKSGTGVALPRESLKVCLSDKRTKSFHRVFVFNSTSFVVGKYYYEVTCHDQGLCRVGWSTSQAALDLGVFF